ncbi:hypothetical protein [Massilia sp. TN1-12]|uniref:hypothetical protein n=1 Tax=Massilia paldalensis TaxID=3377675 RepID=UPI00384CBACB
MAGAYIKVRMRIAWWVRPALAVAFVIGYFSEKRAFAWIDAIVDMGVTPVVE